jgi:hypothetical protein
VLPVACCRLVVCAVNSFPKGSQNYLATAAAGNSVYVLDHPPSTPLTSHKYSAATDVWTTIRRIPTNRAAAEHAASAATVGDRIYVMGGLVTTANAKNEAYNTQTDTWSTKAALPVGRAGAAVGVRSNKIYLIAGYSLLSSMNIYTPSADAWTSGASRSELCLCGSPSDRRLFLRRGVYPQPLRIAGTSLPTARQFVAGSVLGNVLYVAGGTIIGAPTPITSFIGPGDALVYGYTFATDVWASGETSCLPAVLPRSPRTEPSRSIVFMVATQRAPQSRVGRRRSGVCGLQPTRCRRSEGTAASPPPPATACTTWAARTGP